jgi:hypothetical protein
MPVTIGRGTGIDQILWRLNAQSIKGFSADFCIWVNGTLTQKINPMLLA